MKPKTQKTITLDEIICALGTRSLAEARDGLCSAIGSIMTVSGKVEKLIKRHGGVRLFVKPEQTETNTRPMMVFAEFTDAAEQLRVLEAKIRKGSPVNFGGRFQTFGETGVTMDGCQLKRR